MLENQGTAAKTKVPRMYYKNFDHNITEKYGVVCSPADLNSRNEVEILYNAWKTGTTTFQRLTEEEWESWRNARFQGALAEMMRDLDAESGAEDDEMESGPGDPSSTTASDDTHSIGVPHGHQPMDTAITTSLKRLAPADSTSGSSKKRRTAPLADSQVINTLTSPKGTPLAITKKPRKPRSDIGKKRGPRKSKAAAPRADVAASTSG